MGTRLDIKKNIAWYMDMMKTATPHDSARWPAITPEESFVGPKMQHSPYKDFPLIPIYSS